MIRQAVSTLVLAAVVALAPAALAGQDPVKTAIEKTHQPETRAAGIAELRELAPTLENPRPALRALARALTWAGRLDEALRTYELLLRDAPPGQRQELELGRLEILLWQGRLDQAAEGYRTILASDPSNETALVGLARARRWRGSPLSALGPARRAVSAAPDDDAARSVLAAAYLDLGMPYAAADAVGQVEPTAEVADRLRHGRRPAVELAASGSSDSFGIDRLAPRLRAEVPLPGDLIVTVGGGLSHLEQDGNAIDYRIAAGSIAIRREHYELGGAGAGYQSDGATLGEGAAWLRIRPGDHATVRVSARRRPLLEPVSPLVTGEDAFHAAGAGGVTDLAAVERRGVDEARANLQLAGDAGYLYGDAGALAVSDGNRGYAVAAGLGLKLLGALGADGPLELVARADSYLTGYEEQRSAYFSPARFDSHVAGGRVGLAWDSFRIGAEGGAVLSLDAGSTGWSAGGSLEWHLGTWHLEARAGRRDQIAYDVVRAWAAVGGRF